MPPDRRQFLHVAACAAALPFLPRAARAQSYPARPVRIVVGFAPGRRHRHHRASSGPIAVGAARRSVRRGKSSGRQHQSRDGLVVRAPADGYTLLLIGPPAAINVTLYDNLSFNFIRDIAPVAAIVRVPFVSWSIHRFQPRRWPSSLPTPRQIPASSAWRRPVTERGQRWRANCSN